MQYNTTAFGKCSSFQRSELHTNIRPNVDTTPQVWANDLLKVPTQYLTLEEA